MRYLVSLITYFLLFLLIFTYNSFAVDFLWSTSYNCYEWTQSDGLTNVNCDGLNGAGGWTCNGNEEQITSEANYPGGGGGKGQRHWKGDGANVNSGGLMLSFAPESEIWIRWYMKYQFGFQWSPLNYDKILYIHTDGGCSPIVEMYSDDGFSVYSQSGSNQHYKCDNCGWTSIMGGATSDGQWHYYEVHLKMDTNGSDGICQIWIDGDLKIDRSDAGWGTSAGFNYVGIGSNQRTPNNGKCMAVDFDDIAISNSGYIGPISGGGGDTTPPTISITSPTQGQTVSGDTTISANASDNVGVAGVQFKLNGTNLGAEDTTSPYSITWDTTTVSDGSYTLTATARDAAGNNATSTPVTVTVNNSQEAYTISITSPTQGQTVSRDTTISANASDNVGVAGVQFKLNGTNLGAEDTTSPYSITWDTTTVSDGSYTLTATARDAAGNNATSTPVTVTVNNSQEAYTILYETWEQNNINNWDDDIVVGDTHIDTDPVYAGTYAIKMESSNSGNYVHFFGDHPGVDGEMVTDVTLEEYHYFSPGFQWPEALKLWLMNCFESWGAGYNLAEGQGKPHAWAPYYMTTWVNNRGELAGQLVRADGLGGTGALWQNYYQNLGSPVSLSPGTWNKIKIRLKLNTPGSINGIYQIWINDELKCNYSNMNYRGTYSNYGWNHLMKSMDAYPAHPQSQWISRDNIHIFSGVEPAPTAPTAPSSLRIISE